MTLTHNQMRRLQCTCNHVHLFELNGIIDFRLLLKLEILKRKILQTRVGSQALLLPPPLLAYNYVDLPVLNFMQSRIRDWLYLGRLGPR